MKQETNITEKSAMETFSPSDEILIQRVAQGDETALRELVRRHQDAIIATAYRYTNDPAEAEDIAAEVFFKIWKYAGSFRGKSKFSTWSYRITVNTCLNHKRKRPPVPLEQLDRTVETEEGEMTREVPDAAHYQPETAAQNDERSLAVRKALDELPPKQKIAFTLCWFEGRSYKDIADAMQVSLSSVESLLFRAKETLKKKLQR